MNNVQVTISQQVFELANQLVAQCKMTQFEALQIALEAERNAILKAKG